MLCFDDIPRFFATPGYRVNVNWLYLKNWLELQREGLGLDLEPDFQRAHVWIRAQQIAYVEFVMRGGASGRTLYWNCVDFHRLQQAQKMQIVDGKQRLHAVTQFLENKFPVFKRYYFDRCDRSCFRIGETDFLMCVHSLPRRRDVLRWYLELNTGGVVHTKKELQHVRQLLAAEDK